MAKRISTQLRDSLGLSLNEARVYLAALEIGSGSMTDIAKKARIARTTAYSLVEHLLEEGLLEEFKQGRQTMYVPIPPERLLKRLNEQEMQLRRVLPKLTQLGDKNRIQPKIRIIPGDEGVKTVLAEILEEKRPFRAMTAVTDLRLRLEEDFDDFIEKRVKQHLKVHLLTTRTAYAERMQSNDGTMLRTTRFLPTDQQIHTATYVFGRKVALIGIAAEPPVSVIIEDEAIAKTQAITFDLLWKTGERN